MQNLSPGQSRAARGLLGWTQDELAEKAGVSRSTVADFEREQRVPSSQNLDAMINAFILDGIRLIGDEGTLGEGVRRSEITIAIVAGPHPGQDKDVVLQLSCYGEVYYCRVSREALEDHGAEATGWQVRNDAEAIAAANSMLNRIRSAALKKIDGGRLDGKQLLLRSRDFN